MTSSLPSYDLARLFSQYSHSHHANTRNSAGEALVEEEGDTRLMTDSLSTVSWEDINEDQEDYDQDGDDESRD